MDFDAWPVDGNDLTCRMAGWWSNNHWLFTEGEFMYSGSGQAAIVGTSTRSVSIDSQTKPATPLQSRLNDLHCATTELETLVDRLYDRFAHLLPQLPPPGQDTRMNTPEPVKSEVSLRLDDAVGRIRRCIGSTEALIDRVEA